MIPILFPKRTISIIIPLGIILSLFSENDVIIIQENDSVIILKETILSSFSRKNFIIIQKNNLVIIF